MSFHLLFVAKANFRIESHALSAHFARYLSDNRIIGWITKSISCVFLLVFCLYTSVIAQTHTGNVSLINQTMVNAFNFTTVTGNITINGALNGGDPITDLSPLSGLTTVGGNFQISATDETNLDDLANLQTVGGTLSYINNGGITEISFPNLTSTGALTITSGGLAPASQLLARISFPKLSSIDGIFWIVSNAALTDVDFPLLTTVGGGISIQNNAVLADLTGLSAITSVDGNLTIGNNAMLADCCGFRDLINAIGAISGFVDLRGNAEGCRSETEINNAMCRVVPPADPVPTMSQWMLFILGLIMTSVAVVYIKRQQWAA